MKCPHCNIKLEITLYKGIEVERCTQCEGMWFDAQEVDQLEDTIFDQDEFKNTMITNIRNGELNCPKCDEKMKKFDYRWEDLKLDYCTKGDGFWLNKGEDVKILEIISQDVKDAERKYKAEEQWTNALKGLQSPTIISKIKNIIGL